MSGEVQDLSPRITCSFSCYHGTGQGPKLTFLGRRQLATEIIFFSRHMEKCGRQKVSIKFFLRSETQPKIFDRLPLKNHDERIECRPYTKFRVTSNCFKSFLHLLDVQVHYKQTQTFQYTNFYSCHPPVVKKGFIKGEALHLLRRF